MGQCRKAEQAASCRGLAPRSGRPAWRWPWRFDKLVVGAWSMSLERWRGRFRFCSGVFASLRSGEDVVKIATRNSRGVLPSVRARERSLVDNYLFSILLCWASPSWLNYFYSVTRPLTFTPFNQYRYTGSRTTSESGRSRRPNLTTRAPVSGAAEPPPLAWPWPWHSPWT